MAAVNNPLNKSAGMEAYLYTVNIKFTNMSIPRLISAVESEGDRYK